MMLTRIKGEYVIFLMFQMTKLQAAIKYGEEDLPAAKVCYEQVYSIH